MAAVAALTPEIAAQAADADRGRLRAAAAVVDIEAALRAGRAAGARGLGGYEANEEVVRGGNDCSRSTIVKGDADAGMAEADVVVKERYVADMSHAVPIEPHAIVAQWQGDKVTIWSSTQVPFIARAASPRRCRCPRPRCA